MRPLQKVTPWLLALLALGLTRPALAQPPVAGAATTDWNNATVPGTAATNNWTSAGNWTAGIPDVSVQDFAVVNNGGVAYVDSIVSTQAGGVSLGTNAGQSGTLDVLSGGSLTVVDDGPTFPADGSVRIGQAGTGNLFVRPGGSLDSASITLGAASTTSTLTLGGTTPGTATVTTGLATLGRTTRVIGSNVNFSASGGIAFQSTSVFIPEITGGTHSALKTSGTAGLGGTLQVDFNGVTPAGGSFWNLVDAATITGTFASILPDPAVPLGLGQVFAVRTVDGGTNGKLGQLVVNQLPVLSINRNTGAVSITNPGSSGIALDGYTVQSTNGALVQANWQSLATHPAVAGAGWAEANPTANRLSELRSSGSSTLAGSGSWALGNIFQEPAPFQFGQNLEDVVFQYSDPVAQATVNGIVNYTGGTGINNLVLFADPATGNVKLRNTSSFTVAIDGYTVASTAGSLNSNPALWTSLQDSLGNTWTEANLLDTRISELQSSGSTTLTMNGGTTFDLGGLFKTAGAKDLVFQFVLSGNSTPNTGVVVYEPAPSVGVPGDYNKNGIVDAADYSIWRDHLSQSFQLDNEGGISPGVVDAADYTFWKSRFGAISGSGSGGGSLVGGAAGAVPEPTTGLLLLVGGVLALTPQRGRRWMFVGNE
jgi:hypothetical protein